MEFGDYRLEIVPDTEFRLDGGAMFGVVPRVLWEKVAPPDEQNRIRMNMNCLFIDTGKQKILVETGIGEKWTEKQIAMYGISRAKPFAQALFDITGCKPEDIDIVVNTHLHFDHAGGNTIWDHGTRKGDSGEELNPPTANSRPIPQFPNAHYFVSRSEFDAAESPHERNRASYLPENWRPMIAEGQLHLKPDNYEVVPGLTMETQRGHSETMQCVRLERGGKTLYGFADLIPMKAHLPIAWVAGFDLFPMETIEFKKKILREAVEGKWHCLFYHDFEKSLNKLIESNGKFEPIAVE
jgi:glyoxylase-like metal-dependent hydrolase (beta-lactamase superfamily II)